MSKMATSIDDFCADGFLLVRGAFAPEIVRACVDVIDTELRRRAVDPRDPTTWTEPVVRFTCPEGPAFAAAGASRALWEMYDALLGASRWARREGVGGTPSDPLPQHARSRRRGLAHRRQLRRGWSVVGQCAQPWPRPFGALPVHGRR